MISILQADARFLPLPDNSVHCCITSPPYWGLRKYSGRQELIWGGREDCEHEYVSAGFSAQRNRMNAPGTTLRGGHVRLEEAWADGVSMLHPKLGDICQLCGAWRGAFGLEPTIEMYVEHSIEILREIRRVLRPDGACFWNIGDSYSGANWRASEAAGSKQATNKGAIGGGELAVFNKLKCENGLKPKDLCLIPARVALAAQQPWEERIIGYLPDRAWLAALVDGEGCLTILETDGENGSTSYPPILQVRMCDPECIGKATQITHSNEPVAQYPPSQGGVRPSYQWRLVGERAASVVADIFAFLLIKRKQAVILWNHQQVRSSYHTKRGVPMPTEAVEKQKQCRELIQRLNGHEPVDIPSWMREPAVRVVPGWYVRSDIVWAKPNPMPESVRDRPTDAYEHILMLTKSARYFWDAEAVKEANAINPNWNYGSENYRQIVTQHAYTTNGDSMRPKSAGSGWKGLAACGPNGTGRNLRNVWTFATQPYKGAHFATFPEELVRRCIAAGTSEHGCCPKCGAPWVRMVERTHEGKTIKTPKLDAAGVGPGLPRLGPSIRDESKTLGWRASCRCPNPESRVPSPAVVLDPFAGSGTVGEVAYKMGRSAVLIDLAYQELQRERIPPMGRIAAGSR